MLTETQPFREKGWKLPQFSLQPLENALKAVEQPLGTAKRVEESYWEMPKDYQKAFEQFLKGTGKLLRKA